MNSLDEWKRQYGYVPKFPEPKNLRLLLDLGVISKDSDAQTAESAWNHLCWDPVVAEREAADPGPNTYREIAGLQRRCVRFDVIRNVVAQMTGEERAALRARLLARRVKQIPSASEPLKI